MRKQFFMVALAVASLVSCTKDKVENNNTGGGGGGTNNGGGGGIPVPTTKTLKKITQTENGSTTVYNMVYNDKKELVSVNASDNSELTSFTYDADGNVTKLENSATGYRNVYEFEYENGLPARATFKSYESGEGGAESLTEDDIIHYTVEGGKVTKINMDMNVQRQEVNFTLTYNSSGNLAKIQAVEDIGYAVEFTYGTKKPAYPNVFKYVLDYAGFSVHFFAKNDILSEKYDFPGTDSDHMETMQYTYDANGYVLTSDDGTTHTVFEY